MTIAVLIKAVPDTAAPIIISNDGKSVVTEGVKYLNNPYDEYALEEAVIKKGDSDTQVLAVSFGGDRTRQVLRNALAAGADKAVLIRDPETSSCEPVPGLVAGALATLLGKISPDLVIAGRHAVDTDDAQVAERVAEKLGLPHVSNIIRMIQNGRKITVHQEAPEGHRVMEISLPALVTVQKGINEPRYPTVPEVMKARKKPLEEVTLEDLNLPEEAFVNNIQTKKLEVYLKDRYRKILPDDNSSQVKEILEILRTNNLLG
jgi:electron transfer flavoprotein beta subunit